MKRRDFILGTATAMGAMGFPKMARASVSASERKFIFVFCYGGWDPAMIFAPSNGPDDIVDREPGVTELQSGNIPHLSMPSRPMVDQFFADNYENMLLINGFEVRNIDHEICTRLLKTGGIEGMSPDWGTIIGASRKEDFLIPHLVMGGPSFSGELSTCVVRTSTGIQIPNMLNGQIRQYVSIDGGMYEHNFRSATRTLLHEHRLNKLNKRMEQNLVGRNHELSKAYLEGMETLEQVKEYSGILSQSPANAVAVLSEGLARCVSLRSTLITYDTHSSHFNGQQREISNTFTQLNTLLDLLKTTPGTVAPTLYEETTVVVHSEMGKTPQLGGSGKHHWPFTSTLLIGNGFTGNRVVGGYNDYLQGMPIDYATGESYDQGKVITATGIGATLLAMADVDPGDWGLDDSPILGIIE